MSKDIVQEVENKVKNCIRKFRLFTKSQKIGVAASGGKDSTTLLYILKKMHYNVTALSVDAHIGKYSEENLERLRGFCRAHQIPLIELTFREEFGGSLFYIMKQLKKEGKNYNHCTVCGVLRRHAINKHARRLRLDRIATGHNLDDEAQATLMNIFRNDFRRFQREGPVTGMLMTEQFVQRVKPMYFVTEAEVTQYSKAHNFPVIYSRCPYSSEAFRGEVRELLEAFPNASQNIVNFTLKHLKGKSPGTLPSCSKCGEPCAEKLCRACQIIKLLGDKNARVSG